MTEWKKTIHSLPGSVRTPEVMLHQTIEKLPRIKAITMVIMWDDDTIDCDWSNQKVSELCMAAMMLDKDAKSVLCGNG